MSPPGITFIRSRHLSVGMQLYLGELPICYLFSDVWIFLDYSWTCPRRLLVYWRALLTDAAFRGHFVTPHGVTGIWMQIPNTAKNTTTSSVIYYLLVGCWTIYFCVDDRDTEVIPCRAYTEVNSEKRAK